VSNSVILDKVRSVVGNDTLMLFGPSGSGKTTFCLTLVYEAIKSGLKAVYLDTERNLNNPPSELDYKYFPDLREVYNYVRQMPKANIAVIDSLSTPIITAYSSANMADKGSMLLKAVELSGQLKMWTWRHEALAVVTNQPTSAFGKTNIKEEDLPPRLGSSIYQYKEVWRTAAVVDGDKTVCLIKAWRSRRYPRGKPLFRMTISDQGVKIEPLV